MKFKHKSLFYKKYLYYIQNKELTKKIYFYREKKTLAGIKKHLPNCTKIININTVQNESYIELVTQRHNKD